MITVTLTTLATVYMVLTPSKWLTSLMELTTMSWDYEVFLIGLGIAYLVVAWGYEKYLSLRLARLIGHAKQQITGASKKRKEYKVILEAART